MLCLDYQRKTHKATTGFSVCPIWGNLRKRYTNILRKVILDIMEEKTENEYEAKSIFNPDNIMDGNDFFFFRTSGGNLV